MCVQCCLAPSQGGGLDGQKRGRQVTRVPRRQICSQLRSHDANRNRCSPEIDDLVAKRVLARRLQQRFHARLVLATARMESPSGLSGVSAASRAIDDDQALAQAHGGI